MPASTQPRGVFAAALTPMHADFSVDIERLIGHYRWLLDNGCDGIAVLGTTGEANSFSVEERLAVIEAVGASGLPMDKMMIGTGCCALPDTIRLTKAALAAGADNVLMLPPFYYKGVSDDGVFDVFARVVEAVGEDRLRVYLYDFPQMTGIRFSLDLIGRFLEAFPGTIVGIKDSSGDIDNMRAILHRFPDFGVFAGTERYLLDILRDGGPGCISASTNLTAPMAAEVYANWDTDRADALQESLIQVRTAIETAPMVPGLKAMMARSSGDTDWLAMRPPLMKLDPAKAQALADALAATAFRFAEAA
jgi:4-hydroxy-tetrahydrodipicolinate synthase